LIVVGGIYPAIKGLRARFGNNTVIKPYHGKWLFRKEKKWYWGTWTIENEKGVRYAAITLGSDIKESVEL
jgi:hypothetical protein